MKNKKEIENLLKSFSLKINRILTGYEVEGFLENRNPHIANLSVKEDGQWSYSNVRKQSAELYIPLNERGKGSTDPNGKHHSSQKTIIGELGPVSDEMTNQEFYQAVDQLEKTFKK